MAFKRLPNGVGSIQKRKENLRKPYRARKLIRYDYDVEKGTAKAVYYNVGNFATRAEALKALMDFTGAAVEETSPMTLKQCYDATGISDKDVTPSLERAYKKAIGSLTPLWNKPLKELKVNDYEKTITAAQIKPSYHKYCRIVITQIYKYAMAHDVVDKDYSKLIRYGKVVDHAEKKPFTPDEIQKLWESDPSILRDMVLFGCYTGFRPGEICDIRICNVDLDNGFIQGGSKTKAGINRLVPIHPLIMDIVRKHYDDAIANEREKLFTRKGNSWSQKYYSACFTNSFPGHTSHETRHTFATYARKSDMDLLVTKWILGHSVHDLTERVYTHKQMDKMQSEIRKFVID